MNTEQYIKNMLNENLFAVIFPKDRKMESATELVNLIDAAVGIAEFQDDDDNENKSWGVLIDKRKMKKSLQLAEENNNDSNV